MCGEIKMHFLITAGGTREYIDPVRFISNASTGKTGISLARAALQAGHKVTLITAAVTQRPPIGARVVTVETGSQMFQAVRKHFKSCNCLIMAAAVSDYTPARTSKTKIKKDQKPLLTIKLKPTTDILKWAGRHKKKQIVVGFALEDKNLRARAGRKLKEKNLDMIIANTPAAIGADRAHLQIKTSLGRWTSLGREKKSALARKIIRMIDQQFFSS